MERQEEMDEGKRRKCTGVGERNTGHRWRRDDGEYLTDDADRTWHECR